MNTVPRPLQVTEPATYRVELRWPRLLGGETTEHGPFATAREATAFVRRERAGYPGDAQPGALLHRDLLAGGTDWTQRV